MTDLVMNKTRHCPYCPVAAGDDNFMWQHISDHLENQTKYPQFKPVPLPVLAQHVPRNGVAVGSQVPMNNRGGKLGGDLTKEKNYEDISTEKLLTEELSNDGGVGNKVSTDELSNKDLGDEELSTEKLLSNYLNAKELTTEELLNKDLIGEEVTSNKLSKEGDGTKEEISDGNLLNNDLKGRELSDEELLNLHVNDEEISNEDLLNNDLSEGGKDLEESVVDSTKNNFGQNSIPCGESSSNEAEAETKPMNPNPAVPNDTEDRSSKRKGKKPRKSAPKHIDEVLNNPDSNDDNKSSNLDSVKKEVEDPTTSEVEADKEIKQEANVDVNKKVEGKQKTVTKGKRKVEKKVKNGSEIEMKPEIEMEEKGDQDIDAKKNVKGKPKLEAKVKKNVEIEVKKKVELKREVEMEPDASRSKSESKVPFKENPSAAIKLEYLSNPTPDQIKKCISPKYKCPVCSEIHQDFGGHVSLSHGLVRCGRDRACNLFFETMEDRRNHEECVHGTANTPTMWKIICGHCKDVKFPDLYTVVEHRHTLHSFHTCTLCSMITTKDEYYQVHMKSHTIRNPNIFNLKNGKSLLENLLTYPIATLNQGRSLATCNLCSPGLQAQFDVSEGGEKLWEHFKTGHKVKNPAEALLRLFNGRQFHFRTLLNDEKRLLQLEAAAREEEEAAAKQAEAVAQKQREAAAKKLEAAEKEREALAARKKEAEAKEREAVAKKMEAAIKEKEAAAARKREAEVKQREEADKKAEVAAKKGAAKKKEVDAKPKETANKKSETKVDDQSDPLEVMKNVVLGSSVSIKLKSKAQIKPAQIRKIGTNESIIQSTPKASLVEVKPDPDPAEVVAVKVVENKRKRKRTVTKKISSDTQATLSNSPVNVKKELVEDSHEIKTEVVGGLEEASSDSHSTEASIPTIFIKPGSPYTCEVCNTKFTDNGDHLCFQHGMVKCASAKNCQGFFGSSFEKEKHEKESHVDTFSCMPCKMKFNNVYSQLEHRNSGHSQLTCMFCFVGFKCQEKEFSYFKSHMKTHKIGQSLLNDNDERSLFEKLLGDPIVDFNRETMSVSCNLCFKTQSSSGVMSVKEGGNQLWEHFKVIHKIKSSSEMLHLFNGTGFSFSNRKLKYSAKLETFVNKELKSSTVKANESVVKQEISEPKKSMAETSIMKETASKKKRGRPSKVGYEKEEEIPLMQVQSGKVKEELVRDQGLDDLYGNPLAKKSRNNSKVQVNEMEEDPLGNGENVKKEAIAYEGEVKKEVPVELFPQEQVMAAIDDLQENTKPKKKRQRRTKAQIEEDLKKESAQKKKGRKAKDVSIQQADEDVSLNQSQPLEMMDDLEANEDLMLQISKLPATKKAYEESTNGDDEEAIDEQTHNTNGENEDVDHNASNTNYDIATDGQHDEDIEEPTDNYAHEEDVLKTDSEANNGDHRDDIEDTEEPPQINDDAQEDLVKDTDEADEDFDYRTNDAEEVKTTAGNDNNDEEQSVLNNDADEEPSYNTNKAGDEQADNSVEAGGESEEPVEKIEDKEADGMEGADEEQTASNAGEKQEDSNADAENEDAEEDEGMKDADNEGMEDADNEGMEDVDNDGMEEAEDEGMEEAEDEGMEEADEGMEDAEDEGMEDDDEEQADSSAVKGDEIPTLTYSDSLEY